LLGKLGWENGKQIDWSITADEVTRGRPHPDMIHLAMENMGIPLTEAQSVAKIGDSIIDIEEGQSAGCGLSIGITTGAHTAEQMASAKPDHVINSLQELLDLL
jgi:phosphoglycolate phosphatase-like HAD superfamily hydrolase